MKFENDRSVTRNEAISLMKEYWHFNPETEIVSVFDALNRVTSENIYSVNTLPVVRSSRFDGVAVKSSAFVDGVPDTSKWIEGVDYVRADTGDDFPDEFDSVCAVEDVILDDNGIRFVEGYHFDPKDTAPVPAGSQVKCGDFLVPANTFITPELQASLAMGGIINVPVIRKVKVAFIPTGDELIKPGTVPSRGQNIETNGLMLKGLLSAIGADFIHWDIIKDNEKALEDGFNDAIKKADIVLINGGSSRGGADYNSQLIERRSTFFRHGIKAVPGRPVGFGIVDGKPAINVPGPVNAAFLAEHWFIAALIYHWYGLPNPVYPTVKAKAVQFMKKRPGFEFLGRVSLVKTDDGYLFSPLPNHGGIPGTLMNTDGLINIPADWDCVPEGAEVEVELLRDPTLIKRK